MTSFRSPARLRAKRWQRAWFAFVERVPLLRRLFLLRKAHLIRARGAHYAQWGEDVVLEQFLGAAAPQESCYVDVGCFHPKKYSNTWRLYRKGWRGINVDVDRVKLDVFDLVRPEDENVCCAIGDAPGEATLYSFGHYSVLSTLDPQKAAEYRRLGYECAERPVRVRTLTDVFEASRFRGRRIALLSVDVEGHEEWVLRSLDFTRHRPRLVLVEFHAPTLARMQADPKYRLLAGELGYELVNWTGLTAFFMDKAAT
ncbi:MAG: FkbM family methyltransferase [Betaproteobacteria bacterium]|nr:FkbM family methyltransferase [Betaproteobacteria bacterium]MDH4322621.1 FkbM family methyltransferase [Betaproteobacteria bacterium]